ncbi:6,7-dimethyl-8-ribityllumazine synthase [Aliisedimentitalea scapharcae]|uniref:6,7-dimethyl-8-ribityllumazine synthase n=1 Tax=Aliisedimentitalea scapharcae TaxID=1524259 RepID=A0ABZ2XNB6_9RHOB
MAGSETHYTLPRAEFDKPVKLLIVVAPYYKDIADNLVAGAKAEIEAAGGTWELVEVPGALEVPTAISIADRTSNFDGFVALGCVIRGETTHYDTVCNDSSRAIQLMGLQGLYIGNGILTVENRPQAEVRADPGEMNKGGGAAAAALHLIALGRKWGAQTKGVGFKAPSEAIQLATSDNGPTTA